MSKRHPGSRHYDLLDKRRWQHVRRIVLERDGWRCRACGGYGNEVDHVTPLQHGGDPYDEAGLQCLCRGCHLAKTRRENERPDPARDKWREFVLELM